MLNGRICRAARPAGSLGNFEHGSDLIDLARIDANALASGNDAFSFIGSNTFAGTGAASAGQLRAVNVSGNIWQVEGDVNGDGVADFMVEVTVTNNDPLTRDDFIL